MKGVRFMGKIYTKSEMLAHIDYSLLSPKATVFHFGMITTVAKQAGVATVCIPPGWVDACRSILPEAVRICTVISFPLGYDSTVVKMSVAEQAIYDGANEIDMVINMGFFRSNYTFRGIRLRDRDWGATIQEIQMMREVCPENVILKVIVEACYLTEQQKIDICKIVTDAGADYIETSTGFGPGGATLEDVKLFREHVGPNVKIKAAGGIDTIEDTLRFLEAGADRIGSLKVVKLLLDDERTEFSLKSRREKIFGKPKRPR